MTTYDSKKLIDLFLDDELPLELSLEFKQAMFSDPELSAEVSEARKAKEVLTDAFAGDAMSEQERTRVFAKILTESYDLHRAPQLDLPLSGQFQLPMVRT